MTEWLRFLANRDGRIENGHLLGFAEQNNEIHSAQSTTILTALTAFSVIEFAGPEAHTFLQGQLSSDIRDLSSQQAQLSSYSTPKGRMLATFLGWNPAPETYRLMLSGDLMAPILKRLSMFILRAKVKPSAREDIVLLGVAGPEAQTLLDVSIGLCPENDFSALHQEDTSVIRLPGNRFMIAAPVEAAKTLWDVLASGAKEVGEAAWKSLDISTGIPWVTAATQEMFVPQMVNLELIGGGVSFQKGCYPGQEIVARTQFIGKVKRRMFRVHCQAENVSAGMPLFGPETGEQVIGNIVQAIPTGEGQWSALAVMQTAQTALGVHLGAVDGPKLELDTLPYSLPQ